MPVNSTGWEKLPIAERDAKFAFRAATDRLAAKAATIEQFNSWFFWRNPAKPANNRNSYRMPFADVFEDGTVKLVPAAVYSAAAQLSGAHGLSSIPPQEREQIMRTIDRIYDKFRTMWDDPRQIPPWERPSNSVADEPVKASVGEEDNMPIELIDDDDELTAAVRSGGWSSLPTSTGEWDEGAARSALDSWAGDDMGKYAKGFLWVDSENRENKTAYKFPIAKPVNGKLTIFIRAVNNADARLSSSNISAADKTKIQGILDGIQKRYQGSESTTAAAAPVRAPSTWYENPMLPGPTKLRVTEEGRVYGHLAQWNTCHRGVGNSCIIAPHSIVDYAHFKTGTTMTADGMLRPVGNLTYGGGHADTTLGYIAAAAHYDEAGTTVANVNVGEDAHGVWVAGSMAPGTGELEAQQLRSHPLSGDWRRTGGNLELIAALAVNTPGFPIDEPQYSVTASGDQISLVAAGVVFEDGVTEEVVESVTADATVTEVVETVDLAERAKRVAELDANFKRLEARANNRRARTIIDIQLPDRG